MIYQKMMNSNSKSSNSIRVASVVHPTSFLARRNTCISFRVGYKIFPNFKQISLNRYGMICVGVIQKTPNIFLRGGYQISICLRGAYWTSPTDRHDTAVTRNDTHIFPDFSKKIRDHLCPTRHGNDAYFWKQTWGNRRKIYILL